MGVSGTVAGSAKGARGAEGPTALIALIAAVVIIAPLLMHADASAQAPAPRTPGQLPDGPGKATFESVCSLCHSPNAPAGKQWTRELWEAKVIEMLQEEPDVTADERKQIVDYLAATFRPGGRIYINLAGAADLAKLLELSRQEAERIILHRSANGPFTTVEAVKGVSGVDAARIDAKARELEF